MVSFFNHTATTEIYTLSRHDALPILSMNRPTGQNLDAMRHALERLPPLQYLQNGYYGRWLLLSETLDRKSTRLNSSHANISYAVFCLKKKKILATTF